MVQVVLGFVKVVVENCHVIDASLVMKNCGTHLRDKCVSSVSDADPDRCFGTLQDLIQKSKARAADYCTRVASVG